MECINLMNDFTPPPPPPQPPQHDPTHVAFTQPGGLGYNPATDPANPASPMNPMNPGHPGYNQPGGPGYNPATDPANLTNPVNLSERPWQGKIKSLVMVLFIGFICFQLIRDYIG